jgi:hypothetical protein
MWYLVAETTAAAMGKRIVGERNLTQIMSPQELEEAERQAADRLKKLGGQSPSTGIDPMPNQKKLPGVPIEEFA